MLGPLSIAQLHVPSSLRRKTLLIIAVAMIGLVGGLYFLSRALLMRSFAKLEADFASENIERASSALTNEIDTLDRTTSEYGSWDQTYAFVHGHNPGYTTSEFPSATFLQLKVNFVAIFDQHGTLLFSKGFDPERGGETFLPVGLKNHLKPGSKLVDLPSPDSRVSGLLMLPDGPTLVDARPILMSDSRGPVAGTVVMGRLLDANELARLGSVTHLDLIGQRVDQPALGPDFQKANQEISAVQAGSIQSLDDNSLAAYQRIDDIYGQSGAAPPGPPAPHHLRAGTRQPAAISAPAARCGLDLWRSYPVLARALRHFPHRQFDRKHHPDRRQRKSFRAARKFPATTNSPSSAPPSTACSKTSKNPRSIATKAAPASAS